MVGDLAGSEVSTKARDRYTIKCVNTFVDHTEDNTWATCSTLRHIVQNQLKTTLPADSMYADFVLCAVAWYGKREGQYV